MGTNQLDFFVACLKNEDTKMTVMICYEPTEAAGEADNTEFYNQLQALLSRIPNGDMTVLLGDMNGGKVRSNHVRDEQTVGRHGMVIRNGSGCRFVDCL